MSREKCKRAVRALRAGEGEFRAAERACEEAKRDGASPAEITAIWSEGLPGGLGAVPANAKSLTRGEARELIRALKAAGIKPPKVGWCVKAFDGEVCRHPPYSGNPQDSGYQTIHVTVPSSLGRIVPAERASSFGAADDSPFGTHLGFRIATLDSYSTPYYYAVGPAPLGSRNHFRTIRRLKNYMNRLQKTGKLPLVPSLGATFTQDKQPYGSGLVPEWAVVDTRSGLTRYHWFTTRREAEVWNKKYNAGFVQSREELDVRPWQQPEGLGSAPLRHAEKHYGWLDSLGEALRSASSSLASGDCSRALWDGLRAASAARGAAEHGAAASEQVDPRPMLSVEDFFTQFQRKCVRG